MLRLCLLLLLLAVSAWASSCARCTRAAEKVERRMTNGTVQMEIVDFLNHTVCQQLPSPERSACAQLVLVYFPELLDKVFEEYGPVQICRKMGFCPSSIDY